MGLFRIGRALGRARVQRVTGLPVVVVFVLPAVALWLLFHGHFGHPAPPCGPGVCQQVHPAGPTQAQQDAATRAYGACEMNLKPGQPDNC